MKCVISERIVLSRTPQGPLAEYLAPFADWTREQGYALSSLRYRVRIAADFSQWLAEKSIRLRGVSTARAAQYLRCRARWLRRHKEDTPALQQLVEFLCSQRVISAARVYRRQLSSVERSVQSFELYLREQRCLARATITNYLPFIRDFLQHRFGNGRVRLSKLTAADVTRFVQHRASHLHLKRAKLLTTALRSFLLYARYRGYTKLDLVKAVPCVANWSMSSIPRAIASDQVRRLLAHADRTTAIGRRDYAILLLLARLGLRSSEVASLELGDIDWRRGLLGVHGKGGRWNQLPMPADVGAAIAAYLRHGRPSSISRRVFLRARAPIRGFHATGGIGTVVRRAILRAGIDAPTYGAHQFRHGLATEMLRHGASLTEIGQLLGHRSPETTKIYTKVDLESLRTLALPWPGGVR
jgi:integrase/recombinase XerD